MSMRNRFLGPKRHQLVFLLFPFPHGTRSDRDFGAQRKKGCDWLGFRGRLNKSAASPSFRPPPTTQPPPRELKNARHRKMTGA